MMPPFLPVSVPIPSRVARRLTTPALFIALAAFASTASAGPSLAEKATAQALFEDGLQLMGAKRYAEACPKLEESERLDPALGTRFRLSECEEAVGRLASAWAGFLEVADLAHATAQNDREALARSRAAAIEPKLSKINVVVAKPDTPGLEVAHDSVIVGRGQWGTPVPIDPGVYTVTATATGKKPWRGSVTIAGDGTIGTLSIPQLEDAPVTPAPGAVPLVVGSGPGPAGQMPEAPPNRGTKILGFTVLGVGVAGIAMSGVLGLVAKSNYNAAGCGPTFCNTASSKASLDSARELANVATVVFTVGAVAAAAGVVIVLVAPSSQPSSHLTGAPSAMLHLGAGTAMLEGSF
jgi:hypothetical protein